MIDTNVTYSSIYSGPISCFDRQIEELQARKDAMLHDYCYTDYRNVVKQCFLYKTEENKNG